MIEQIGAIPITPAASQEVAALRSVTPAEVEQFESKLQETETAAMAPVNIQTSEPVKPEKSLGEVIGEAVERVRANYTEHTTRISDIALASKEAAPAKQMSDLFSLQYELIQLSVQQDFTARVADKLSQGVQTLFKNQ